MLQLLKTFISFEYTKSSRFFAKKTLAKSIVSVFLLVIFFFVASLVFFFFTTAFRFINAETVEGVHDVISLFIYELFLAIVASLALVSSTISILFNLFKRNDEGWVTASPEYRTTTPVTLFRANTSSLLITFVVFFPALLAFTFVNHTSIFGLVFLTVSMVLLIALVTSLVLLSILAVGRLYLVISSRVKYIPFLFRDFVLLIATIFTGFCVVVWKIVQAIDLVVLFKANSTTDSISPNVIGDHFMLLPTHMLALQILAWQKSDLVGAVTYFCGFTGMTVVMLLCVIFFSKTYFRLWLHFHEHVGQVSFIKTFKFKGSLTWVLLEKEWLLFVRNIRGVLWLLFLLAIWAIQIGTNTIMAKNITRYAVDIGDRTVLVASIEFAIAIYFISSFALRFVFPSFSIERATSWITGVAPYKKSTLFLSKYIFFTALFSGIAVVMNSFNNKVLGVSFFDSFSTYVLFVSIIIFIVGTSLVVGLLFPNTETNDPEVMSTTMPGLFLTAGLLIAGFFSAALVYVASKNHTYLPVMVLSCVFVGISLLQYIGVTYFKFLK